MSEERVFVSYIAQDNKSNNDQDDMRSVDLTQTNITHE